MSQTDNEPKVTLTTPLIRITSYSKKYPDKEITKGYYLNIPYKIVEEIGFEKGELLELTIKRLIPKPKK